MVRISSVTAPQFLPIGFSPGFDLGSVMVLVRGKLLLLTFSWIVEVTLGNGAG